MKTTDDPESSSLRHIFLEWYHGSTQGRALQTLETAFLKSAVQLTYNRKTLQVGRLGTENGYIDADFGADFGLIDRESPTEGGTFIQAEAAYLPIASESIDTLILPHLLEFEEDRHEVLREVQRVLKPGGRLLTLGLSPWHPQRLLRRSPETAFWKSRPIPSHQLLDWLSLLRFDAETEALFAPSGKVTLKPDMISWHRLRAGLPMAYAIKAIKRNYTLISIEPQWNPIKNLVPGNLITHPSQNT